MINRRYTTRNKVLNYFFLNEKSRVYINELARLIEADPKNVYRILVRLEEEGVLASDFQGKQRYFHANRTNSMYKAYKDVFRQTSGIEVVLRDKMKDIPGLEEAYIFGSYAQQRYGAQSDIDVLLVGTHKALHAQKVLHTIEKHIRREINVVNITPYELNKKKESGDQFIKSIFDHKVIKLL